MGKGFQNFTSKKDFHSSEWRNLKRKWEAEQKNDLEEKRREELRVQYEKEQEILDNNQLLELKRSLQRRVKTKKQKVDTKSSKGRKIRYVEIPRLVNFFPATPERVPWTHERRDELFKSLFV